MRWCVAVLAVCLVGAGAATKPAAKATTRAVARPTTVPAEDYSKRLSIGMTRDEAVKVLGEPREEHKFGDGFVHARWFTYKDGDRIDFKGRPIKIHKDTIDARFGDDGKIDVIEDNRPKPD